MTSKSTDDILHELVVSGKLVSYEPRRVRVHQSFRRRIWMVSEVIQWVAADGRGSGDREHRAAVRAFLDSFIFGADFDDDRKLKEWKPDTGPNRTNVFSFRIIREPQHRLFGRFVRIGEIVVTNHATRTRVGDDYDAMIAKCNRVFGWLDGLPQISGARADLIRDFEDS